MDDSQQHSGEERRTPAAPRLKHLRPYISHTIHNGCVHYVHFFGFLSFSSFFLFLFQLLVYASYRWWGKGKRETKAKKKMAFGLFCGHNHGRILRQTQEKKGRGRKEEEWATDEEKA